MSEILTTHFPDLDDIKFEEFYDFFCTDLSNKTKVHLNDHYNKIKGDNDAVGFEDIARYYSEDYDDLVGILQSLSDNLEKLDEIYSKKDILNNNFVSNLIEKIVYTDIECKVKEIKEPLHKLMSILDGNINKIKKESHLEAKIDDILAPIRSFPDVSPIKYNEYGGFEKTAGAQQIFEMQKKLNEFQKELNVMKMTYSQVDNESRDSFIGINSEKKNIGYLSDNELKINERNEVFESGWSANKLEERTEMLTGHVWVYNFFHSFNLKPKSRMLLAIVSKMSKEGLLNNQQRGILKDLIIENDSRILQCLRQYELDGDRKNLYKNCLNLATAARFLDSERS